MNLSDITTKPWILALFKRDDGERFLLGDGYYDFKDSLQHFKPNSIANDIVELQGADGQLLAGQVRRSASQAFDGYIGDGTTPKQTVEQRRKDFLMFFRKKHFYTVIYIFCDGSAIQRERGYLVDAPSVPEIRQKSPEYHVALNFEDVNYYEYAENAEGEEIFSNTQSVVISTLKTGGLVWDNLGAVSEALQWANYKALTGDYITISDGLDSAPLSLTEIDGNATQSGTPTPDSPQAVQVVTGENKVKIHPDQKNLVDAEDIVDWIYRTYALCLKYNWGNSANRPSYGEYEGRSHVASWHASTLYTVRDQMTNPTYDEARVIFTADFKPNTRYTISCDIYSNPNSNWQVFYTDNTVSLITAYSGTGWGSIQFTTLANKTVAGIRFNYNSGTTRVDLDTLQLEEGTSATPYTPFISQSQEINLGKNLLTPRTGNTQNGMTGTVNADGSIHITGTATAAWANVVAITNEYLPSGTYCFSVNNDNLPCWIDCVLQMTDGTWQTMSIRTSTGSQSVITKDCPLPIKAVRLNVSYMTVGDSYDFTIYPMIEKGTTPSGTYAPYFTPIELAKIGTYQDRIYKDEDDGKWYLEKKIGKVTYDGTEGGWQLPNTSNVRYPFGHNIPRLTSVTTTTLLCDTFYVKDSSEGTGTDADAYTTCYGGGSQVNWLFVPKAVISGTTTAEILASWNTWLADHPTTVYYVLATPTTTEITDATLLEQLEHIYSLYEGVNNISITPTAGAQGTMKISYASELNPGGGFVWEDGGNGGTTTITIDGVDSALPTWTINGPATNPTLTNITTGQTITWTGTVPAGQTLTIDMNNQTAMMEGANVYAFITGSWIGLAPGANRISYNVLGTDQPSTLSWNNIVG